MNSVSGGMVFWAPAVTPVYSLQTSLYSASLSYMFPFFNVTNTLIHIYRMYQVESGSMDYCNASVLLYSVFQDKL